MKLSIIAIVAAAALAGCGGQAPTPSPDSATAPADELLAHKPYLGVACPTPNSLTCDRVGLYVRLSEPAVAVDARIGARSFALDDGKDQGKDFVGFLEPAGLGEPGPLQRVSSDSGRDRWIGEEPVSAPVALRITRKDGALERTQLRVGLMPGYG